MVKAKDKAIAGIAILLAIVMAGGDTLFNVITALTLTAIAWIVTAK